MKQFQIVTEDLYTYFYIISISIQLNRIYILEAHEYQNFPYNIRNHSLQLQLNQGKLKIIFTFKSELSRFF